MTSVRLMQSKDINIPLNGWHLYALLLSQGALATHHNILSQIAIFVQTPPASQPCAQDCDSLSMHLSSLEEGLRFRFLFSSTHFLNEKSCVDP